MFLLIHIPIWTKRIVTEQGDFEEVTPALPAPANQERIG